MAGRRHGNDPTVVQNAAKTLFANLRFSSIDEPIKSVVVTSSVPNEGKSTIACSLAQAIASGGKRVLIMECDMRRRSLYRHLGVRAHAGLYAVLSEQVPLNQAIVETGLPNMYFLDAEPSVPNPPDIIASHRFAHLLETLENAYDYVVIDTPPVGTFIDAALLASLADATVFVVREGFVKRNEVATAFEQLKKAGANVVGAVQNHCETGHSSDYYYYEYYGSDKGGKKGHGGKKGASSAKGIGGGRRDAAGSAHHSHAPQGTRFK